MAEFPLYAPSRHEVADAVDGLQHVLQLVENGQLVLPTYLTKLLRQLEETLEAARPAANSHAESTDAARANIQVPNRTGAATNGHAETPKQDWERG